MEHGHSLKSIKSFEFHRWIWLVLNNKIYFKHYLFCIDCSFNLNKKLLGLGWNLKVYDNFNITLELTKITATDSLSEVLGSLDRDHERVVYLLWVVQNILVDLGFSTIPEFLVSFQIKGFYELGRVAVKSWEKQGYF